MMDRLPRSLLETDAGAIAVAIAWLDGYTQAQIGKAFGYKNSTMVNIVIANLMFRATGVWPIEQVRARKVALSQIIQQYTPASGAFNLIFLKWRADVNCTGGKGRPRGEGAK